MQGTTFTIGFDDALRQDLLRRLDAVRWSNAVTTDWRYRTCCGRRCDTGGRTTTSMRPSGGSTPCRNSAPALTASGFGFSDRPQRPAQVWDEDLFHVLMTEHLGYPRYLAAGTDIGAGVAARLALKHPEAICAIHVSAVVDPPELSAPLTSAQAQDKTAAAQWQTGKGAYMHLHQLKPQTLAFALADSRVGLARGRAQRRLHVAAGSAGGPEGMGRALLQCPALRGSGARRQP